MSAHNHDDELIKKTITGKPLQDKQEKVIDLNEKLKDSILKANLKYPSKQEREEKLSKIVEEFLKYNSTDRNTHINISNEGLIFLKFSESVKDHYDNLVIAINQRFDTILLEYAFLADFTELVVKPIDTQHHDELSKDVIAAVIKSIVTRICGYKYTTERYMPKIS